MSDGILRVGLVGVGGVCAAERDLKVGPFKMLVF